MLTNEKNHFFDMRVCGGSEKTRPRDSMSNSDSIGHLHCIAIQIEFLDQMLHHAIASFVNDQMRDGIHRCLLQIDNHDFAAILLCFSR